MLINLPHVNRQQVKKTDFELRQDASALTVVYSSTWTPFIIHIICLLAIIIHHNVNPMKAFII